MLMAWSTLIHLLARLNSIGFLSRLNLSSATKPSQFNPVQLSGYIIPEQGVVFWEKKIQIMCTTTATNTTGIWFFLKSIMINMNQDQIGDIDRWKKKNGCLSLSTPVQRHVCACEYVLLDGPGWRLQQEVHVRVSGILQICLVFSNFYIIYSNKSISKLNLKLNKCYKTIYIIHIYCWLLLQVLLINS